MSYQHESTKVLYKTRTKENKNNKSSSLRVTPCKACPAPLTQRLCNSSDIRPRVSRVSQRSNKRNFSGRISTNTPYRLSAAVQEHRRAVKRYFSGSCGPAEGTFPSLHLAAACPEICPLRNLLNSNLTHNDCISFHKSCWPLPEKWTPNASRLSGVNSCKPLEKTSYWQRNKIRFFDYSFQALFILSDHFSIIIISLISVVHVTVCCVVRSNHLQRASVLKIKLMKQ